jgi:hypothetical protein
MKKFFLVLLALMIAYPTLVFSSTADVKWSPPTQYEDGSSLPLNEIKSYKIYYGTKQGGPYQFIVTVQGSNTAVTISNLTNGTWYFVATTVSTQDSESAPTPEVSKVINVIRKPKPPSGFVIQ